MTKMDSQTISDKKNHDQSVQPREYCLIYVAWYKPLWY